MRNRTSSKASRIYPEAFFALLLVMSIVLVVELWINFGAQALPFECLTKETELNVASNRGAAV
jgi:hypothetical protein